jgi:threonine dehydrogenase-like Zn-dependent dehydrogenase
MKAVRIDGPGKISYDTVDDPKIKDQRDIILKVTATAIVGQTFIYIQEAFHKRDQWCPVMNLWEW